MTVIHIVELNLHEIPAEFVVAREQIVESLDIAVIGKSQIADASRLAFL